MHIVRAEDVMRDSRSTLGAVCEKLGLDPSADSLTQPTWNGSPLKEVYPWGTIRIPTPEANLATARELSSGQIEEIRLRARPYLEFFDYQNFV
jgi:hypothetical protein